MKSQVKAQGRIRLTVGVGRVHIFGLTYGLITKKECLTSAGSHNRLNIS